MTRNFTRPGISDFELKELQGKRQILINPDWDDIEKSLNLVQKRTRKSQIEISDAKEAWNLFHDEGIEPTPLGIAHCPSSYGYDKEGTLLQIVDIAPELVGVVIGHEKTPPGMNTIIPVNAQRNNPRQWANEVITTFWTHLTDEEIQSIHEKAFLWAMEPGSLAQWNEQRRIQIKRRRRLQLQQLIKGTKPKYISEFSLAIQNISRDLKSARIEQISWREFQTKWMSIARRYQREFLGMIVKGHINRNSLENYVENQQRYALSLDFWSGQQKIFPVKQVVFRIESSKIIERIKMKGPNYKYLLGLVEMNELGPHPTTAKTIGWLRVHIDDNRKLCFIDEVQSDLMEDLYKLKSSESEEGNFAKEILKEIDDWHLHGFATVQHWSHSIGYKTGMHSLQSALNREQKGMTPSDRKWQMYYQTLIKHFKLVEILYKEYRGNIFIEPSFG